MKEKVSDLETQWKNYLNVKEGKSALKEGSKVSSAGYDHKRHYAIVSDNFQAELLWYADLII